jgi:hypothetical protein
VDQGVADLFGDFPLAATETKNRAAVDQDLVGQARVVDASLGERSALVEAEELFVRVVAAVLFLFRRGFRLHDDGDVAELRGELAGKRGKRLLDEALELGGFESNYCRVRR